MRYLLAALLLPLLVACGQEAAPPTPTPPPVVVVTATPAPSATPPPSPTAEPSATPEPTELPVADGWQRYPIEGGVITLDLPASFYVFAAGALEQEALVEAMGEAAPAIAEQLDLEALMAQGVSLYAMEAERLRAEPESYPVTVNVVVKESAEVPLTALLEATITQLEEVGARTISAPEIILVDEHEMGLLEYEFTYTFPEGERDARLQQLFFIAQERIHVVTFTYPPEADETLLATIDAITQNIRVIEE